MLVVYCLGFHETIGNIQWHLDLITSHVPNIYFCNYVIG
jgi:hypothetical protein